MRWTKGLLGCTLGIAISGCAANSASTWAPAQFVRATPVDAKLLRLPPPDKKIPIAVYSFTDQTGQFKNTTTVQTLSRAVTQGATSILVKALQDVGNRQWFQIVERERLDDLLRERAVIREMRAAYLGEKTLNTRALPPLIFSGVLLEGGVIGYDSNVKTGGLGARFLGIGGNVNYQEDTAVVYLRAVSTKTGEVLVSVNARKSISSVLLASNTFRYVSFDKLLEVDAGVTENEPTELALRQAIEQAVYGIVMEGAEQRLWCFNAPAEETSRLLREHIAERDHIKFEAAQLPVDAAGNTVTGACGNGSLQAATAPLHTGATGGAESAAMPGTAMGAAPLQVPAGMVAASPAAIAASSPASAQARPAFAQKPLAGADAAPASRQVPSALPVRPTAPGDPAIRDAAAATSAQPPPDPSIGFGSVRATAGS